MDGARFEFGEFVLDSAERRLTRDGAPIEVNSRYFDALLMLVRSPGRLIGREEFLDEAWSGVPVTDEALSQCITQLRKSLGDSPARPRFIETVPKHGYRFIAEVRSPGSAPAKPPAAARWSEPLTLALAAAIGGGVAGIGGGLVYGLSISTDPLQPGVGAASILLVMLVLGVLAGLLGGFGVGLGIGTGRAVAGPGLLNEALGGALGGMVVGGAVSLLGLDGLTVLLGRAPPDIGGALEGLALGASVAAGAHLVKRGRGWPSPLGSALLAAAAGALLPLLGGRLMGASLAAFAETYPDSRIRFHGLGRLLGEDGFGPLTQSAFGAFEALVFGAAVALAVRYWQALKVRSAG